MRMSIRKFLISILSAAILTAILSPTPSLLASDTSDSSCPSLAGQRGKNLVANAGFELDASWHLTGDAQFDDVITHSGKRSLKLSNPDAAKTSAAMQVIKFNPPLCHPFRVSGWSRAEKVHSMQDYNIYLDVIYEDNTALWAQTANFVEGTHDWEKASTTFTPTKPVKEIRAYIFLRKAEGTAWFDDLRVEPLPLEFKSVRILPNAFGPGNVHLLGVTSLPCHWTATLQRGEEVLSQTTGSKGPIRACLSYDPKPQPESLTLTVRATDCLAGETIEKSQAVSVQATSLQSDPIGYATWTESSMRYVMPYDFVPENHSNEAAISLAGNEYESFQAILLPAPDVTLKNIRIETTDLVCPKNNAKIDRSNVQWHQVGYVHIDELRDHPAAPNALPGWWPEVLLPVKTFDVKPNFAQSVWTTIYAPPGTPAGEYQGEIIVRPEGRQPTRIKIKATVYGFSLPTQGHLKTAFALMDGFLEKVYGRPLLPKIRREFGDLMLQYRLNPDDISRTEMPPIDDLVHYDSKGLNAFNVLNMVEPRGEHPWRCNSPASFYTPEFKAELIKQLDPYVAQLREKGLIDKAYIYTFDESKEEFFPTIKEFFGMIKERYPEVPTFTTAYLPLDPKLMKELNVDWNCPLTPRYDMKQADACRKEGLQVWAYICCGPGFPYANWLLPHPLIEGRILWWQAYHQKFDGLLYWGVNFWSKKHNDQPIDPTKGPLLQWSITTGGEHNLLHGDGVLLYPGPNGPFAGIRLANIRDGLEDYEYLWLLAQKKGNVEEARKACIPITTELQKFTRDPVVLQKARAAIARELE